MSWFKQAIATFGFEGAKVDTLLAEQRFSPGAELNAKVQINTANRAIRIDGIRFSVWSQAEESKPVQIAHCVVGEKLQVESNQELFIPVTLALPDYTPLSLAGIKTWLHTELDIPLAPDPQDTDPIEILADTQHQPLFDALDELGYQLKRSDLEALPQQSRYKAPFVQQFHFAPTDNAVSSSELQLFWHTHGGETELLITEIRRLGQQRSHSLELHNLTKASLVAELKQRLEMIS